VRILVHDGAITNGVVMAPRFQLLIWVTSVTVGSGGFDDIAMVILLPPQRL
jgi:hypothetical protein